MEILSVSACVVSVFQGETRTRTRLLP